MRQRLRYGTLTILIFALLVALDVRIAHYAKTIPGSLGDLLQRGSLLPLACLLMVMLGAVELAKMLRARGMHPLVFFAYAMVLVLMLTPWLSAAGWLGTGPAQVEGLHWQVVVLAAAVVGSGLFIVLRGQPAGALHDLGATFLIVFYLGFLGSFAVQLRCGRDIPAQDGAWLLLIAILIVKCSDIGAYFVGSRFGRHKLAPRISPGKTVEGMFGGLAASVVVAVGFASASGLAAQVGLGDRLCAQIDEMTRFFHPSHNANLSSALLRAVWVGLLLSAVGQIGDLVESCFKRDADTKDSGALIPQFGGILDLIDSPLAAMPVAWFVMSAA